MDPIEPDPETEDDFEPEASIERRIEVLTIPPNVQGERADKILARMLADVSREKLAASFEAGEVLRGGMPLKKRSPVSAGEVVDVVLPEPVEVAVEPVEMPLELLYEDEHLVAVNKPAGLVVHPGNGVTGPTLVHGLLHRLGGTLASAGGELRPGIVHRLDRDTTGVILAAKTDLAFHALQKLFAERVVKKHYLALVRGAPDREAGEVREPIGRHPTHRTRMTVRPDGRESHTGWNVEERFAGGKFALIRCALHTGRTHQIRVHLSHLGHPILGDPTYGYRPKKGDPMAFEQVLLHSADTELLHPITHKTLQLHAPPPAAFCEALAALRSWCS
ncbi:MAG: RluA family pseudouridine synthase [Opitutales bacterium]